MEQIGKRKNGRRVHAPRGPLVNGKSRRRKEAKSIHLEQIGVMKWWTYEAVRCQCKGKGTNYRREGKRERYLTVSDRFYFHLFFFSLVLFAASSVPFTFRFHFVPCRQCTPYFFCNSVTMTNFTVSGLFSSMNFLIHYSLCGSSDTNWPLIDDFTRKAKKEKKLKRHLR